VKKAYNRQDAELASAFTSRAPLQTATPSREHRRSLRVCLQAAASDPTLCAWCIGRRRFGRPAGLWTSICLLN